MLSLGDLVLYEVKDGEGSSKGLALARVLEIFKHSKTEFTVKIRFLASEDADVAAWGREIFNEKQGCRLHFCSGKAEDCRVRSRSKSMDFAHTDSWRICSYRSVMRSPWAGPAALEDLSIMVSRWLREHGGSAAGGPPAPAEEVEDFQDIVVDEVPAEARDDRSLDGLPAPAEAEVPAPEAELSPGARAGAAAVEAGRKAMQALRGGSPQLLPGVAKDPKKGDPGGDRRGGARDPRRLAAPKPAPRVSLVPATVRGQEPWMDDVSVQEGLSGYATGEDAEEKSTRKRKRGDSLERGQRAKEKKQEFPGVGTRGDFFTAKDPPVSDKKDKKKKKDKKRRRRPSTTTSSKSEDEGSSAGSLYGKEKHRHVPLADKAKKRPGRLLKSGLEEMSKYLARRLGEGSHEVGSSWRDQRVGAYVSQVLMIQHPAEKMGPRNAREIQTLSLAIDALMDGQYALCGDYLMQRLKAVESSLTDGWKVAEQQEIVPPARASLTSDAERSFAARRAVEAQKLLNVVKQSPR